MLTLGQTALGNMAPGISWCEDYYVYPSAVRESLFNIDMTSSVVPVELSEVPAREVKQALRFLLLRKTASGEVAAYTPDSETTAILSQNCSINSEVSKRDQSIYKTRRTVIAPLVRKSPAVRQAHFCSDAAQVVHRTTVDARRCSEDAPCGMYEELYRDAFAVAGKHYIGKRVVVGPAVGQVIEITKRHVEARVKNPLFVPYGESLAAWRCGCSSGRASKRAGSGKSAICCWGRFVGWRQQPN